MPAEQQRFVALVTGAASGIGRAVCRAIAAPGAAVLVHTRGNAEGVERTAEEIRAAGGEAAIMLGDLADADLPAGLVDKAVETFGGLDWIVSNAGYADRRSFADLPENGLDAPHAAMTRSFFNLVRTARPHLCASPRGRVVAVSAFGAHRFPFDGDVFPSTAAAKAGMEALARALAAELAPEGVTVNCVVPGYTRKDAGTHSAITPERWREIAARIPIGRPVEPAEVAAAIAFFLSEGASGITGQLLHVDGGLSL